MELKDFIKDVLTDIVNGQTEFNEEMKAQNKKVKTCIYPVDGGAIGSHGAITIPVSFNLKLSVQNDTGSKTAIGVMGGLLGAGINGTISSKDESENRISFTRPLTFNVS